MNELKIQSMKFPKKWIKIFFENKKVKKKNKIVR